MKLIVDEIIKKKKNRYLVCNIISKRAKKYNNENRKFAELKGEINPDNDYKKKDSLNDAFNDFIEGKLDERLKEHE